MICEWSLRFVVQLAPYLCKNIKAVEACGFFLLAIGVAERGFGQILPSCVFIKYLGTIHVSYITLYNG